MAEFKSNYSYWHFANAVRKHHRYFRDAEAEEYLNTVIATSKDRVRRIKKGAGLWRAQRGCAWEPIYQDEEYIDDFPRPYLPKRMKPLPDRAYEGRVNPKGIPCLYLASKEKTAISEVRPRVGQFISVGLFRITRNLKVIDCSVQHRKFRPSMYSFTLDDSEFGKWPELTPEERELDNWFDIDNAFSRPLTPEGDQADYVPTQILAELFKTNGFDGIAYKSSLTSDKKMYNVAIFDVDVAELYKCHVFEIKSLDVAFEEAGQPYYAAHLQADDKAQKKEG